MSERKRRGLISAGTGRAAVLPASSCAVTVTGEPTAKSQGRATSAASSPASGGPTGKAGMKRPPTFTPTRDAPLARNTTSPPPPWARYWVLASTSSAGGVKSSVTGRLSTGRSSTRSGRQ